MDLERQLIDTFGRERHFTVPKGYFEHFEQELLENLPIKDETSIRHKRLLYRIRPYVFAAACLATFIIMGGAYFHAGKQDMPSAAKLTRQSSMETRHDVVEQATDYMMIDEDDLYAYLSDY